MPILVKIGSSPANDVILHNPHVSGRHADITVMDNGDIFIEDKGSTNGTFVGPNKTRLKPGQETKIQRGDYILFGNEPLNWNQIPRPADNKGYTKVVTLGSNFRNDVVITDGSVSRYHATLKIDPKKRVFIVDNKSTNGTKVNGVQVHPGQPTRIKKGDNVILGDTDITNQLAPHFPSNPWPKVALGLGAVAVVAAIVFAVLYVFVWSNHPAKPKQAVAYVMHEYHYTITPKDNPWNLDLEFEEIDHSRVQGTAFFIDEEGRLGTCLHIAEPWKDEFDPEKTKQLQRDWKSFLSSTLPREVTTLPELRYLLSTGIGQQIRAALDKHGSNNPIADINAMLNTLFNSELNIVGVSDEIRIAYPGRMYTHWDEMDRANVVAKSDNAEADVAILQLNSKKLPQDADYFDVTRMYAHQPEVMKESLSYMGFPSGIVRNLDPDIKSLEPYVRESKVAKEPSKFFFEIQDDAAGGASGSPVYNKNNELAGILYSTFAGDAKTTRAIHAKYLKKLYDENEYPTKKNK